MGRRLVLSVSQLNEYVRRLLQQDPLLSDVELRGEISNLKLHQTGTLFFTLKDEQSAISCVMYAQDAEAMQIKPFDGMQAVVTGSIGLYPRSGQYQFYARELRPLGIGVLYERYQQLKEQLEKEGLFRSENKQPIPGYVETIGVVSSPTGAVIHDIMNVAFRRDPDASILLCPVRVQGTEAVDEVVSAIRLLDQLDHVSVIVLARGGGSIEDLWTFNEENVVRAVAACRKPIVSAIGHETDFTLCDFAADLRAPTPSAAAECVVPLKDNLLDKLATLKRALFQSADDALSRKAASLTLVKAKISANHPAATLERNSERIQNLKNGLRMTIEKGLDIQENLLNAKVRELQLLSPYHVLERGYALVRREGRLISSADSISCGDTIQIVMKDGHVTVKALDVKPTVHSVEGE